MADFNTSLLNIHQTLVACGVHSRDSFDLQTAAEIISEEVFDDRFSLMMDISW